MNKQAMTSDAFIEWRKRLGMTQREAAERLGLSWRGLQNYEAGRAIPKYVALACAALAHGIENYSAGGRTKRA